MRATKQTFHLLTFWLFCPLFVPNGYVDLTIKCASIDGSCLIYISLKTGKLTSGKSDWVRKFERNPYLLKSVIDRILPVNVRLREHMITSQQFFCVIVLLQLFQQNRATKARNQ